MTPVLVLSATVLLLLNGLNHSAAQGICLKGDTCSGNGVCSANIATPPTCSGQCKCTDDYGGKDCSGEPICTVSKDTCGDHGTCLSGFCQCKDGYSGTACTVPPICTSANGCGKHGKCSTCDKTNYFCVCYNGYGGHKCEKAPICTRHSDCGAHGQCNYRENPYTCSCIDGYRGEKCDKAPYCTTKGFECGTRGHCNRVSVPARCQCYDPTNTTPLCNSAHIAHVTTSLIVVLIGSHLLM